MASKQLVDIGVFQYSLDNLGQAKRDANDAAKHYGVPHFVLQNDDGYFGPVNENKKNSVFYTMLRTAYVTGVRP